MAEAFLIIGQITIRHAKLRKNKEKLTTTINGKPTRIADGAKKIRLHAKNMIAGYRKIFNSTCS